MEDMSTASNADEVRERVFVTLSSEESHPFDRLDISLVSVVGPKVCLRSAGRYSRGRERGMTYILMSDYPKNWSFI